MRPLLIHTLPTLRRLTSTTPLRSAAPVVSLANARTCTAADKLFSQRCAALSSSASLMSTAAAAAADRNSFTSFEMESELMWAQDDLNEPHLSSSVSKNEAMSQPPSFNVAKDITVPAAPTLKAEKGEAKRMKTASTAVDDRPLSVASPTTAVVSPDAVLLPAVLQRRRWPNVVETRFSPSAAHYAASARDTLNRLRDVWGDVCRIKSDGNTMGVEDARVQMQAVAQTTLQHAHAEALLVIVEMIVEPVEPSRQSSSGVDDWRVLLLPVVVQLLCVRHVELAGKHVAQLSRLLLSHSPLFLEHSASPARREGGTSMLHAPHAIHCSSSQAVWEAFLVLCYATRRRLRRQHNLECLEAFLWGLYFSPGKDAHTMLRSSSALSPRSFSFFSAPHKKGFRELVESPSPPDLQVLPLPSREVVRKATLQHLLHRALQADASSSAHLLLSWTLLLAPTDVDEATRDAVVHRLRQVDRRESSVSTALRRHKVAPTVRQWSRLALELTALCIAHDDRHGKGGKALLPGAAVFARLDQQARLTDSWAVAAMDRHLLKHTMSTMTCCDARSENTAGLAPVAGGGRGGPTTRVHKATAFHAANPSNEGDVLRLAEAASATFTAYARLRWGPILSPDVPPPAPNTSSWQDWSSACLQRLEEEVVELVHTALDLPKHAWVLSEVVALRLTRALRLHARCRRQEVVRSPRHAATSASLTRRQLLAAFRRLARHSRAATVTYALLFETLPADMYNGSPTVAESTAEDAFCFAAFIREAVAVLAHELRSSQEALAVMDMWAQAREMSATPVTNMELMQLRLWARTLPSQFKCEELAQTLQRVAAYEESRDDMLAARSPPTLSAGEGAAEGVCGTRQLWKDILAAVQPPPPASLSFSAQQDNRNKGGNEDSEGEAARKTINLEEAPLADDFAELWRTPNVLTPQGNVLLRRLQWTALLNGSAQREWMWCGLQRSLRAALRGDNTGQDILFLVEASEKETLTADEESRLRTLRLDGKPYFDERSLQQLANE